MPTVIVNNYDTFEQWRVKTNDIATQVTTVQASVADLGNNISTKNVTATANVITGNVIASGFITVTDTLTVGNTVSASGNITSSGNIVAAKDIISSANLTIAKNISASGNLAVGNSVITGTSGITSFTSSSNLGIRIKGSTSTNDYSGIDFSGNNEANPLARVAVLSTGLGSYLRFGTTNNYSTGVNNTAISIGPTGNVGIMVDTPLANLHIGGEIIATGDITAFYSDRRLKDNVRPIENALEKVLSLNGIVYTGNDKAKELGIDLGSEMAGLFADEVQRVQPQVVKPAPFDLAEGGKSKSGENYMTIQYEKLVPLLVEAIKDLNAKIDAMGGNK